MTRSDKALRSLWIGLCITSVAAAIITLFFMGLLLLAFLVGHGEPGWIGIFFIVVGVVAVFAYNDKITWS